jgi:uncharacterized protein YdhG (YjbR/CyaY superfamily)
MVRSEAKTADEYLSELPEERRAVVSELRSLIRRNLPGGYAESVNWGMLSYEVPLERYPDTYNGQPLSYVALAAQKNNYALYLTTAYADPKQGEALRAAFARAGKKLDMGKSCLRFRKVDDLPLDALAKFIAATPPEKLIAIHEAVHPPKKKKG